MNKKTLSVLHLASFSGNIGDNANHAGARSQFAKNLAFEFVYTELEIREFYWKQRFFDTDFIAYANQFDVLLIGGGNYFELWVEHSRTGCSIDLPDFLLADIKCPVLFYGLGVDAGQGVPDSCHKKFKKFLDCVLGSDQFFVSVRNDGAMETLQHYFGERYAKKIISVPDGGFFVAPQPCEQPELAGFKRSIIINIAGDMLETRFSGRDGNLTATEFFKQFSGALEQLIRADEDLGVVLVPHIFKDLAPIAQVIDCLPDELRRRKLSVAPYLTGTTGADKIFDLYRQGSLVLGMRFHANVCALGMRRPTLGLSCYPQIDHLYRELNLPDNVVAVNKPGFAEKLLQAADALLSDDNHRAITDKLLADIRAGHEHINKWLLRQFG